MKNLIISLSILLLFGTLLSCNEKTLNQENTVARPEALTQDFRNYWYSGKAEITSYELSQARYGELRNGNAVLVFVTEDFLPREQVKADNQNHNTVSVLKLNTTKKYNTGIYPYSIMTSTFLPIQEEDHAIKVTNSVQEWCGQVYTQVNNHNNFEVTSHSYFEGEADQSFTISKTILEDELWGLLRIDPDLLPTGSLAVIPSLEFCRLKHIELKPYSANLTKTATTYSIDYPDIERTLTISFNAKFPFEINGWEETFRSGFGPQAKKMTSTATKIKKIKSAYWSQNSNQYLHLRDSLGL